MSRSASQRLCLALVFSIWLAPSLCAQNAGIPPEWELSKDLAALADQTQRLKPLLDAVKPKEWVQKGAPDAYATQLSSLQAETDYAIRSVRELEKTPERLTLALDSYFRLQSMNAMLISLSEGIRKYQNPALADLVRGVMTDSSAGQEKLRLYTVQLAAYREEQLSVLDREAQRCRTKLLQQPPQRSQGVSK